MAETKIEWADRVWNFIRGCSRVSSGCEGCYAEAIARRFSGEGHPYAGTISERGKWNGNITFHEHKPLEALKWKKPQRVFVNSMSDLFHENVKDEWIDKAFAIMALTPHITYQVLTKRPDLMQEYLLNKKVLSRIAYRMGQIVGATKNVEFMRLGSTKVSELELHCLSRMFQLPNVWLGVSVEDQKTANERIPHLLKVPAAVRFLSVEPLLGEIDLSVYLFASGIDGEPAPRNEPMLPCLHWVIVGGESGANARPMHPDWVRSIRDQCQAAGVPFFFKQWGEWWPIGQMPDGWLDNQPEYNGKNITVLQLNGEQEAIFPPSAMTCFKVGKRKPVAAGRQRVE